MRAKFSDRCASIPRLVHVPSTNGVGGRVLHQGQILPWMYVKVTKDSAICHVCMRVFDTIRREVEYHKPKLVYVSTILTCTKMMLRNENMIALSEESNTGKPRLGVNIFLALRRVYKRTPTRTTSDIPTTKPTES